MSRTPSPDEAARRVRPPDDPPPLERASGPRAIADINKELWFGQRFGLETIYYFAQARRVSPWALLGEVLLRVIVLVPPAVQLPALVGGNASLNLFAGIVGRSGQGKGTAAAAARDVIDVGRKVAGKGIGSGEGLVKLFGKADKDGEVTRTSYAELLSIYEIDSFGAQQSRSGATIGAELRKTYSGEPIGFAYADGTKRVLIDAHSYRLCVSAGIQPGRGAILLDDADAGTPQRFVWLPATDSDAPDIKPDEPAPLEWEMPPEISGIKHDAYAIPYVMEVCEAATGVIDAARLARLRGEGDALDGHALLTRLKLAAALSLFDGRTDVTDDDWSLSGLIMEVSDQTRESVAAELRKATAERNVSQGHAEAARARIVSTVTDDDNRQKAAQRILTVLEKQQKWVAGSAIRRELRSALRDYFSEAIDYLAENGQILVRETKPGHGLPGVEYAVPGK